MATIYPSSAQPAGNTALSIFEIALADFKKDLKKKKDIKNFSMTTMADLKQAVIDIQAKQHSGRRQRGLQQLGPFLEAMTQLGEVVQVFCNASEFVAFIYVCDLVLFSLICKAEVMIQTGTYQIPFTGGSLLYLSMGPTCLS